MTEATMPMTRDEALRERVRDRYAAAARQVTSGEDGCGCGGPASADLDDWFGAGFYAEGEQAQLPAEGLAGGELGLRDPDRGRRPARG